MRISHVRSDRKNFKKNFFEHAVLLQVPDFRVGAFNSFGFTSFYREALFLAKRTISCSQNTQFCFRVIPFENPYHQLIKEKDMAERNELLIRSADMIDGMSTIVKDIQRKRQIQGLLDESRRIGIKESLIEECLYHSGLHTDIEEIPARYFPSVIRDFSDLNRHKTAFPETTELEDESNVASFR